MMLPATVRCRRDEALAAIQSSIMKQQQQELTIQTEIQGYKKDITKEQVWCWVQGPQSHAWGSFTTQYQKVDVVQLLM